MALYRMISLRCHSIAEIKQRLIALGLLFDYFPQSEARRTHIINRTLHNNTLLGLAGRAGISDALYLHFGAAQHVR